MFDLQATEVSCKKTSKNTENLGAGGDTRMGASLFFEFQGSNEFLDKFDPKLRPSLYEPAISGQEDLIGHLPSPKFSLGSPIDWPYVGVGYTLIIHPEFDANQQREIDDCKVDQFTFEIKNEGVVGFKFRVYCHPSDEDIGHWLALEKHSVSISLIAPRVVETSNVEPSEESPQDELFDESEGDSAIDVLYPRALASVRATGNPTASALQTELKIDFNHAALLLARLADEGVIAQNDDGDYVLVEAA